MKSKPPRQPFTRHQMISPGDIAPGDIVQHAAGGPLMGVVTVLDSRDVPNAGLAGVMDNIRCCWFINTSTGWAGPVGDVFATSVLVIVEKRGGVNVPRPERVQDPLRQPPFPEVSIPLEPIHQPAEASTEAAE